MKNKKVALLPLAQDNREQFILDNQWAFKYGAMKEFGQRDDHVDNNGEIISRKTIEECIDAKGNDTYCIVFDGEIKGGVVVKIDEKTNHNHLELFFVKPEEHSKGIGFAAWQEIEKLYPSTIVWETCTPYFEKRNIHFYVNKCGFQIVEFFNEFNVDKNAPAEDSEGPDEMFRFVKVMEKKQ